MSAMLFRRHLCEFTGLDFEMAIKDHYNEACHGEAHRELNSNDRIVTCHSQL
jgi:hypothetical protein